MIRVKKKSTPEKTRVKKLIYIYNNDKPVRGEGFSRYLLLEIFRIIVCVAIIEVPMNETRIQNEYFLMRRFPRPPNRGTIYVCILFSGIYFFFIIGK